MATQEWNDMAMAKYGKIEGLTPGQKGAVTKAVNKLAAQAPEETVRTEPEVESITECKTTECKTTEVKMDYSPVDKWFLRNGVSHRVETEWKTKSIKLVCSPYEKRPFTGSQLIYWDYLMAKDQYRVLEGYMTKPQAMAARILGGEEFLPALVKMHNEVGGKVQRLMKRLARLQEIAEEFTVTLELASQEGELVFYQTGTIPKYKTNDEREFVEELIEAKKTKEIVKVWHPDMAAPSPGIYKQLRDAFVAATKGQPIKIRTEQKKAPVAARSEAKLVIEGEKVYFRVYGPYTQEELIKAFKQVWTPEMITKAAMGMANIHPTAANLMRQTQVKIHRGQPIELPIVKG